MVIQTNQIQYQIEIHRLTKQKNNNISKFLTFEMYHTCTSQVKSQSIGYLPDRSLFFRSAIRFVR